MTDDLRTRIAEVIYSHEQYFIGGNPACDCEKWKGAVVGRESHADHLADMLIAELGLRRDTTCHIHDREGKRRCTRYVTDWRAFDD